MYIFMYALSRLTTWSDSEVSRAKVACSRLNLHFLITPVYRRGYYHVFKAFGSEFDQRMEELEPYQLSCHGYYLMTLVGGDAG